MQQELFPFENMILYVSDGQNLITGTAENNKNEGWWLGVVVGGWGNLSREGQKSSMHRLLYRMRRRSVHMYCRLDA